MATAFPLIVISLSQGELSRDWAHTEQFSSPPIQTAAVFTEAEQLNGRKTTKERQTDTKSVKQTDSMMNLERDKSRLYTVPCWHQTWPHFLVQNIVVSYRFYSCYIPYKCSNTSLKLQCVCEREIVCLTDILPAVSSFTSRLFSRSQWASPAFLIQLHISTADCFSSYNSIYFIACSLTDILVVFCVYSSTETNINIFAAPSKCFHLKWHSHLCSASSHQLTPQ